ICAIPPGPVRRFPQSHRAGPPESRGSHTPCGVDPVACDLEFSRTVKRILAFFALTGLALALPPGARAGFTSPPLILSGAGGAEAGGQRSASLRGTFDFENAVQLPGYPISLIVFQGTTFVRYPFTGAPVTGTSAVLADGILTEAEVPSLDPAS